MVARVLVGVCGASGVAYAADVLKSLRAHDVETHLVVSRWADRVLAEETDLDGAALRALAARAYDNDDLAAPPASSSFLADGMVVIPASIKSVADMAHARSDSLIARAADNMLRLHRRLVVAVRETPLSEPALENLARLARFGAVVLPLCPGFYHRPATVQDLLDFMTAKVLDTLGIASDRYPRWRGGEEG